MIDHQNILENARRIIKEKNPEAKIYGIKEEEERVVIYFLSPKRIPIKEINRDLEFLLNLPIRLERLRADEIGRVGETLILGEQPCCATFLRSCPFQKKYGCGYGFRGSLSKTAGELVTGKRPQVTVSTTKALKTQKKKKKRKKVVRRIVIK